MVAADSILTKDLPPFCTSLSAENSQVGGLKAFGHADDFSRKEVIAA